MIESHLIIKKHYISLIFFSLVVLFLTRQIILMRYSFVINIFLLLFFIINSKSIIRNISSNILIRTTVSFILILLLLMVLYSLCLGNEPLLIARFFIILVSLLLAYFVKPHVEYISIFVFFITLQALLVITFELILILFFDYESYLPIRMYFLNNNLGDIYTINGNFWKIQIRGNALLPFAFFISMIYYEGKKKKFFSGIFLLAILCAGNFAFILGTILFTVLYYMYKTKWTIQKIAQNSLFGIMFFLIVSIPLFNYFTEVVKYKSIRSNPIRIDQTKVLINNMNENLGTIIFGQGLGNVLNVRTQWRDYSGNIYFELQSLYILNQVGILFFVLYVIVNIIFTKYSIKYPQLLIAYFSYIFYAFFNPYFLDTNHIVVIIILLSLKKIFDEKNILNSCYI